MWRNIEGFLERFKNLKTSEKFNKEETLNVINKITNIELVNENIEIRGGVLYIKISDPVIRSQIFLYKEKIIEEIEKKLGYNSFKEIRF